MINSAGFMWWSVLGRRFVWWGPIFRWCKKLNKVYFNKRLKGKPSAHAVAYAEILKRGPSVAKPPAKEKHTRLKSRSTL